MTPVAVTKKRRDFDPHAFLATIGEGRKFVLFPKKQTIFVQGDTADVVANQKVLSPDSKRVLGMRSDNVGRSDKGGHEPETGVD